MKRIEANVKMDKYGSLDEALADYRRLFANCRQYNVEGSIIYEDSRILERLMNDKVREVGSVDNNTTTIGATTIKKITPNG